MLKEIEEKYFSKEHQTCFDLIDYKHKHRKYVELVIEYSKYREFDDLYVIKVDGNNYSLYIVIKQNIANSASFISNN